MQEPARGKKQDQAGNARQQMRGFDRPQRDPDRQYLQPVGKGGHRSGQDQGRADGKGRCREKRRRQARRRAADALAEGRAEKAARLEPGQQHGRQQQGQQIIDRPIGDERRRDRADRRLAADGIEDRDLEDAEPTRDVAQHAKPDRRREHGGKGKKTDPGRRQQHPEDSRGREHVGRGQRDLGQDQCRPRRLNADRTERQRLPPGRAKHQKRRRQDQQCDRRGKQRLGRGPKHMADTIGAEDEAESRDRRKADADGDRDEQDDAGNLAGGQAGGGIDAVAHRPTRQRAETDRVADRIAAKGRKNGRGQRRPGAGVAQPGKIIPEEGRIARGGRRQRRQQRRSRRRPQRRHHRVKADPGRGLFQAPKRDADESKRRQPDGEVPIRAVEPPPGPTVRRDFVWRDCAPRTRLGRFGSAAGLPLRGQRGRRRPAVPYSSESHDIVTAFRAPSNASGQSRFTRRSRYARTSREAMAIADFR